MASGRQYLLSITILIFGALIVYMTGPRVVGYLVMQGGDSTIFELARGKEVSPHKIGIAVAGRKASLRWFRRGRTHLEIAGLYLVLADNPSVSREIRKSLIKKSMSAFRTGLALAPRNPYSWIQFVQAHIRQDRHSSELNIPLRMSYYTAPEEPKIVVARVQVGYRARNIISSKFRPNFQNDIRLNLKHQPRQLTFFARRQFSLPWLRDMVKGNPKLLRDLYNEFLRLPPPGHS